MTDKIIMITKYSCAYCEQAQRMLQQRGLVYDVLVINKDIARDDVVSKYPEQKKVPIILINDNVIGGYSDLMDYLNPPLDTSDDENLE